jgi:molybdopterin-guanine dinucleotide biosynthesis protein A
MIAGIVLAGGKGERIGGSKPLLPFNGRTLIEAVIDRVAPQVGRLALNVPSADEAAYREHLGVRFDLVTDPFEQGFGPLAGVIGGLTWAQTHGADWLATFPCDAPFIPIDLVAKLQSVSHAGHPAAAEDASGFQGSCAIWPIACLEPLRERVQGYGLRSLQAALNAFYATRCRFEDEDAFFNVNTPEDLGKAARLAAQRRAT